MKKDLIQRFLEHKTSEEENQRVLQWLSNPENESEAAAIFKTQWDETDSVKVDGEFDKPDTFEKIRLQIKAEEQLAQNKPVVRKVSIPVWMKVAAVLLVTVGISYLSLTPDVPQQVELAAVKTLEKETRRGQRSTIVLADGSKVILNAESKISYDENFGKNNREIVLQGEAFFEVAKNPELPFRVTSSNAITTAIGTSFNISAYPEMSSSTISLATGKVSVDNTNVDKNSEMITYLLPGEGALVSLGKNEIIKTKFDAKSVMSWKTGILYFDNTPLEETFKRLERWYNVKFEIISSEDISHLKGTGEFENQRLSSVLKVLSYSMNFQYQIKGKTVIIDFDNL